MEKPAEKSCTALTCLSSELCNCATRSHFALYVCMYRICRNTVDREIFVCFLFRVLNFRAFNFRHGRKRRKLNARKLHVPFARAKFSRVKFSPPARVAKIF